MNIYTDYIKNIELAMDAGDKNKMFSNTINSFDDPIKKSLSVENSLESIKEKDSLFPSLEKFASEMGLKTNFDQKLGSHPDFAHLKGTNKIEKHYIISTFIDIKGSTNLFRRYTPETVLVINDTIQKAAIHTCLIFGGYIHRLQGDGLFVYYGGKNISKEDAVKHALLSTSIFSYFVKNDLKKVFDQKGIENIKTRTGIDLGNDKDVVWSSVGIGEISEITTCSLHTSLAPKMQSNATDNGIVIGDHVKNHIKSDEDFTVPVCHRTKKEEDRYIYEIPEESFRYTQHDFDWLKFLKHQDFIATDLEGRLSFKSPNYEARLSQNIRPIAIKSTPYWNF